jgi:hypothetical protein
LKQYALAIDAPIQLNLTQPAANSFYRSYIDPVTKKFTFDSHYTAQNTYLSFDAYGNPQSTVGLDGIKSTTGWGYNNTVPMVSARNADATQFAFSDFETSTGLEFVVANGFTAYYGTGRTGNNSFYPGAKLTKTLSKANVASYQLSFWINSTSDLPFTVNVKDANGVVVAPYTFTVPSSGGTLFSYFSRAISVSNVLTSTFTIELQATSLPASPSGGSSSSLLPVVDDISFYPTGADLASYVYTFPYGINAATSGNQTAYTVYDNLGREKFKLDTYKNIRIKNTYHFPSDVPPTLQSNIVLPAGGVVEGTNVFTVDPMINKCIDGVTYQWSLDNSPFVVGLTQTYSFTTYVLHTLTLQAYHPLYGTQSTTISFKPAMKPCSSTLCAAGAATICGATLRTITTFSCPGVSPPGNTTGTTFAVSRISVNESIISYQWSIRLSGAGWSSAGSGSQYTVPKILQNQNTYDVQCTITTNGGRTGVSNIMSVYVITDPCQ